jgi:hypothetical protein
VRRRTAARPEPVRERLVRFIPTEWCADRDEAWRLWCDSRREYVSQFPNGHLGDELDELRGRVAEKRRAFW